jgi:hypothetical protein
MAKQTYTVGQTLTAAQMTQLQGDIYNPTVSVKTASYVLVAADAGTRVEMNVGTANTVTVNTGLFTAGDTLIISNKGAGQTTITAGTATVSSAGVLTLDQYANGELYFVSAGVAIFSGSMGAGGDITNVTAGTGLSGGGASGSVTLAIDTATTVDKTTAQTLTNKTLTAPIISTISNTGTLTLPTTTGTVALTSDITVTASSTTTLTNKTLTDPKITQTLNSQTGTSYTLVLTDANKLVELNNAAAITLTLPPSVFSVGQSVDVYQRGAGQVTFTQGSGVTIRSTGATSTAPKARVQYSAATVICIGASEFLVVGDLS